MTESDALQMAVDAAKAAQAAAEEAANKAPDWLMIAEHLSGPLLVLAILAVAALNYRRLGALLDRLSGFKALGAEIQLEAKEELAKAAASISDQVRIRTTVSGEIKKIKISADNNTRVLKRAATAEEVLQGRRLHWLDDHPTNNAHDT